MEYITNFSKSYQTMDEYNARLKIWKEANQIIEEHNSSQNSYKLGHNKFSDTSELEMIKMFGDVSRPEVPKVAPQEHVGA